MFSKRLWIAVVIIAILIVAAFILSVPHARDGNPVATTPTVATSSEAVTLSDSYTKGIHTLSGTVEAPDACAMVTALATTTTAASSTTIILSLSMPDDTGVCLMLPTPIAYSTTIAAPKGAPVSVLLNGVSVTATTTP